MTSPQSLTPSQPEPYPSPDLHPNPNPNPNPKLNPNPNPTGLLALAAAMRSNNLREMEVLELSSNVLAGEEDMAADTGIGALAGALEAGHCPRMTSLLWDDVDM